MSNPEGTPAPRGQRAEALADRLVRGPLAAALIALAVVQLACWLPHYLTWPWFADQDVFATAAQGWDADLKPYRDLRGNNFPGTTYVFWAIGKVTGWGNTAAFYAVDAALLIAFGLLVLAWSRRRLGAFLPGAIALALLLGYYLGLDYTQTAQRDWHAPLLAIAGLLLAEVWPGWVGGAGSVLGFAAAMSIRPHPFLFLPALASAIDEGVRPPGGSIVRTLRAGLFWSVGLAALLAIAFAPLALSGVLGDFVAGVRMASFGSKYNHLSAASFAKELSLSLFDLRIMVVPLAILVLWPGASVGDRRLARTWLLALAGAILYRPISPQPHAYLIHPLMIAWSINAAVAAHLLLKSPNFAPTARLAALLLLLGLGATIRPRFCNPQAAIEAVANFRKGEPSSRPLGYVTNPSVGLAAKYDWRDCRDLLNFLRQHLPPTTRVANALKGLPAITGPAGRLPALPAESIAWLRMVAPEDEGRFATTLEATPDSVVVWVPSEVQSDPDFPLPVLTEVIERLYEPDARFGPIEVWRRKDRP